MLALRWRKALPWAPVGVGALATAMVVLWVVVMASGARPPVLLTWGTTLPSTALAAVYCWRTASRLAGAVPRRFWRLVALSMGVQGVGGLLSMRETMLNVGAEPTTGSPLTIAVFLVAVSITAVALLGLPGSANLAPAERRRFAVDATIVVLTVGYLVWRLSFSRTQDWQKLGGAFAIMTVVLLGAVVVFAITKFAVLGVSGVDRGALHRLSAGVGVAAGLATLSPMLAAQAHSHAAMVCLPPVSLGVILAARRQARAGAGAGPRPRRRRPFSYLPYIAVAATDAMMVGEAWRLGDRYVRLAVAVAVALTVLVVYRQVSALTDNANLLQQVDRTVRDLEAAKHQLSHQAAHDALTGLANRRLFAERMSAMLAAGAAASVVLIDLDDFKTVNDQLGHAVGDDLLVAVAGRLQGCVRPDDTVARLGGDEFALLLPSLSAEHGIGIVERINTVLAEPVSVGGRELGVRCSIGIADIAPDVDSTEVLRRADVAMYAAKTTGKGRYASYDTELDARDQHDADLGAELRQAVQQRELHLRFEPVVRLADGAPVAAEAVVCWNHPRLGPLALDDFAAAADRAGVSVPLGTWALREACQAAAGWACEGVDGGWTVGVRAGARQLRSPGFADTVAAALADTGLLPARLAIEVTEAEVLDDPVAAQALRDVADFGVAVTLDRFGTGHGALNLLHHLPAGTVKVDEALVQQVVTGQAPVVGAMATIARGCGLTPVARGVTTAAQALHLAALGYRFGQGPRFAGPLPEAAAGPLLASDATPVAS